jgi:hypothetical protein
MKKDKELILSPIYTNKSAQMKKEGLLASLHEYKKDIVNALKETKFPPKPPK